MPFSVALHLAPRLATVRFVGRITLREVQDACTQRLGLPDWRPGTPEIWDFRAINSVDASPEDWRDLVESSRRNQERIGANRVAVLSFDADMASFFELYAHIFRSSGRTFRHVRSREAAMDWLEAVPAAS